LPLAPPEPGNLPCSAGAMAGFPTSFTGFTSMATFLMG
jgi:hypothetical protein